MILLHHCPLQLRFKAIMKNKGRKREREMAQKPGFQSRSLTWAGTKLPELPPGAPQHTYYKQTRVGAMMKTWTQAFHCIKGLPTHDSEFSFMPMSVWLRNLKSNMFPGCMSEQNQKKLILSREEQQNDWQGCEYKAVIQGVLQTSKWCYWRCIFKFQHH